MSVKQVRKRVHAAADRIDVPLVDVDAVVTRAAAGHRRPRRGRLVLAAAIVVVVGVVGGVVWRSGVLQPADSSPAKATPEALAAVALDHIDPDPSSFELLHEPPEGTVGVDMRFNPGPAEDGELVRVSANPGQAPKGFCRRAAGCETIATDAGDVRLRWEEEVAGQDPGLFSLLLQTEDEHRLVLYSGVGITGDPREQDLGIPVDDLVGVLSDERFGLTTTREMVDTRVEGFPRPDDDDPAPTTPQSMVVAQLGQVGLLDPEPEAEAAYEIEPPDEYAGGDDLAARIELEGDVSLTVVLDRKPGPDVLDCPDGWMCVDDKWLYGSDVGGAERLRAFTDGSAMVVTQGSGYAVVQRWDQPGFTGDDNDELLDLFGNVLIAEDIRPRTTVERVREGERLEIWEDR